MSMLSPLTTLSKNKASEPSGAVNIISKREIPATVSELVFTERTSYCAVLEDPSDICILLPFNFGPN